MLIMTARCMRTIRSVDNAELRRRDHSSIFVPICVFKRQRALWRSNSGVPTHRMVAGTSSRTMDALSLQQFSFLKPVSYDFGHQLVTSLIANDSLLRSLTFTICYRLLQP